MFRLGLCLTCLIGIGGCRAGGKPIVVYAASSLARAFSDLKEQIEREQPGREVRLTLGGSQEVCRKLAELNDRADVVATADYRVIDAILRPTVAAFNIQFTTNELVLAHLQHSRHTEEISAASWPEILQRPGVRLGMVAPDLAPIGYVTLLVWELAAQQSGAKLSADLAQRLRARVAPEHVAHDEAELLQLLQVRAVDYAFLYRSTAEEHNLKIVSLPDTCNLGSAKQRATYARATVKVQMRKKAALQEIRGAPILYGVTIPRQPVDPDGAALFLRYLLGEAGQRSLRRTGFRPLSPAPCDGRSALPAALRALTR